MALTPWLALIGDPEPDFFIWIRALDDPTLDEAYWQAMAREHPSQIDGLSHLPIEREVTPLDERLAIVVVEAVRLHASPRAA